MAVHKHGKPIADSGIYSRLVAEGKVRLTSFTTDDIDRRPVYPSDWPGSPIQTILAMSDDDATREGEMTRILGGDRQV